MDDKQPVTKEDLENSLAAQAKLITDHLVEKMRDMQTEILRAFEAFASGQNIRLRKLEADHSNLDAAVSGRMDVLERRLFEIEKRLMMEPPKLN